jgi:hypothetical protein
MNSPLDDKGFGGGYDPDEEAREDKEYERRSHTPSLVGVRTSGDDPTILILAKVGGASDIGEFVQSLLRPPAGEFMTPDSSWVDGACDPLGAVPYLIGRLMDSSGQELYT